MWTSRVQGQPRLSERMQSLAEFSDKALPLTKVYWLPNTQPIPLAVKQVPCYNEEVRKHAEQEYQLAYDCRHPNVCEVSHYEEEKVEDVLYAYIVMKHYPKSLAQDIAERSKSLNPYPGEFLMEYLKTLVSVFKFMQEKGIAHRDIKPPNILMEENSDPEKPAKLYVCDFGFAKKIDPKVLKTLLGTAPFLSPALRRAIIEGKNDMGKVQHNAFKSDVYSLGVTMINLATLGLPTFLTLLRDLQLNLTNEIQTISQSYPELKRILTWMLTVEEDGRPDFIELYDDIVNGNMRSYADDEPFPEVVVEDVMSALEVSLQCTTNYIRVSSSTREEVPCLLSLKAQEVPRDSFVDLVCVIDISGSMWGEFIEGVCETIFQLIMKLTDRDRVSLVTFSNEAKRLCPLVACTEEGKRTLERCLGCFVIGDLTNITSGISVALEILQQRRHKNSDALMILFTDGKHSVEDQLPIDAWRESLRNSGVENLRVKCFAVGKDQDINVLTSLGEDCTPYNFETSLETIFDENFPNTKVVAKDIVVSFQTPENPSVLCQAIKPNSMDDPSFSLAEMIAGSEYITVFNLLPALQRLDRAIRSQVISVVVQYVDTNECRMSKKQNLEVKIMPEAATMPSKNEEMLARICKTRGETCLREVKLLKEIQHQHEAIQRIDACLREIGEKRMQENEIVKAMIDKLVKEKEKIEYNIQ